MTVGSSNNPLQIKQIWLQESRTNILTPKIPFEYNTFNITMVAKLVGTKEIAPQGYSFNILKLRLLKWLAKSRYVPLVFQVFMLLIFIYAIYVAFAGYNDRGNNFGILMFWSVFWPTFIMISLVTVGKMWCSICPLGALSAAAQRFGLNRPFPAKLRGGIIALVLWIGVVWLVREIFDVSSQGVLTGWFFLGFVGAALIVGFIFRDRSWCQHVCPIGIISGLWSMLAFVELRPTREKCDKCRSYECVRGSGSTRGCPMGLHPGRLDSNRDCTYCLNCIKTCPHDSPQIRLRLPGIELVKGTRRLIVDAGFALWVPVVLALKENMEHYNTPAFLVSATTWVQELLGTSNRFGVWFFLVVVFNGSLLLVAYWLASRYASEVLSWDFKKTFATFSYMFVPIVLVTIGGHSLRYFFEAIWGIMVSVISATLGIYAYHEPTGLSPAVIALIGNNFLGPVLYAAGFFGTMVLPFTIAYHRELDHRKALRAALPFSIIATGIAGYFLLSHEIFSGGTWRW